MSHGLRSKNTFELLPLILAGLTVVIAVFSVWQAYDLNSTFNQKTAIATPAPLPALKITSLVSTLCSECWSPAALASSLAGLSQATMETVSSQTPEGQALIKKYNVSRAPTLVVTGQIDDSRLSPFFSQDWKKQADARVFTGQKPVYFNPLTYEVIGKVTLLQVVDPACLQCADISPLGEQLRKAGVFVETERTVNSTTQEGAELINKYKPLALPFVVMSKDASAYTNIIQGWEAVGTRESDGSFIWRRVVAPFVNTTTNQTEGLVKLVEIDDSSCSTCYNVSIHESLLANLGLFVSNVTKIDINSTLGKEMTSKYNVTQVPTILVSADANAYPAFVQVWPQVGTQEADGMFVFRNLAAIPNATVVNVSTGAKPNTTVVGVSVVATPKAAVVNVSANATQNVTAANASPG